MACLTFNASVSNKQAIAHLPNPFQIMPTTTVLLSDKAVNAYTQADNSDILLHMNYITKIYTDKAVENDSRERFSIRQYVKLGQKLGTKDILIHMPCSKSEHARTIYGIQIMCEEILAKGMNLHLEIAAWTKDYIADLPDKTNAVDNIVEFIDWIDGYLKSVEHINDSSRYPGKYYFVIDTAHLHANGCNVDDMLAIISRYKDRIKYIHFNGNINQMFTSDTHVPMFDSSNKIAEWQKLSTECARLTNIIFIAEVTKIGAHWEDWQKFASQYGFSLVKRSEQYSY